MIYFFAFYLSFPIILIARLIHFVTSIVLLMFIFEQKKNVRIKDDCQVRFTTFIIVWINWSAFDAQRTQYFWLNRVASQCSLLIKYYVYDELIKHDIFWRAYAWMCSWRVFKGVVSMRCAYQMLNISITYLVLSVKLYLQLVDTIKFKW